jgi:hypothetical protein
MSEGLHLQGALQRKRQMSADSAQLILHELGETLPKLDTDEYETFYNELTKPAARFTHGG